MLRTTARPQVEEMEQRRLLAGAPAMFVTTDTSLVAITAEGSRSTLASPIAGNRGVEVVGGTIYVASPVNDSIPGASPTAILGYNASGVQVSSTPVPVSWFARFTALSDGRFALFDNANDKVYFIDASGDLLHTTELPVEANDAYQNSDGTQVGNTLMVAEDGFMDVLSIDLGTYALSNFRSMPSAGEWLSGIACSGGWYYTGTQTAVLKFNDVSGPIQIASVPVDNITSIAAQDGFAYVTVNSAGAVYQVDLLSGTVQTLYSGLTYAQDVELVAAEPSTAGPLVISGSSNNDAISLQFTSTDLLVTINSAQTHYALNTITSVTVNALEGDDVVDISGNFAVTMDGGLGNDTLTGGDGGDFIRGDGGDDVIAGGTGDDTLYGNTGNDALSGGDGNDQLHGGLDNDHLHGNKGFDLLNCGSGSDVAFGEGDSDSIYGADGTDSIDGGAGDDLLFGQGKADTIYGADGSDTIDGGAGNDSLLGQGKADSISGGVGDDTVVGGAGNDTLLGGDGNDRIDAQDEAVFADSIVGGAGDNTLLSDPEDVIGNTVLA